MEVVTPIQTSRMAPHPPGCIFEYSGRIPETAYSPTSFNSPLEEAVYKDDIEMFSSLVKEGEPVSVRLKIGEMSCLEYAAMKGYTEVLQSLISHSICATMLHKYFTLDDVVERAYLISKNKDIFFDQAALAEANRYVAALFTAIAYNQPRCVQLILQYVGRLDAVRQHFFSRESQNINAGDLATMLGHMECYDIIEQWQKSTEPIAAV